MGEVDLHSKVPFHPSFFGDIPHLVKLGLIGEASKGYITIAENKNLPFKIERVYWTYSTPENILRGHHAHKELRQILVAAHGLMRINVEDRRGQKYSFDLNHPSKGLYMPGISWRTIQFSGDAVLLCLASMEYSESDYLRDYSNFQDFCQQRPSE